MIQNSVLLLFGNIGTPELIIILVIVLLLFGAKKIPELMKGLGKGVSSFKKGMNEIEEEIKRPAEEEKDKSADDAPKA